MLRAGQETSFTTLLDEIKAIWAGTLVERSAVESHQSIGAVERMNREVAGLLHTVKTALEARIGGKVTLDRDLVSWMIQECERRDTPPSSSSTGANTEERSWSSERSSGRGSHPRRSSASWTSVWSRLCGPESDEHVGPDHRGVRRFEAVRREPKNSWWSREVNSRGCGMPLGHEASRSHFPRLEASCNVWRSCTRGKPCAGDWDRCNCSGTASGGSTAARRRLA